MSKPPAPSSRTAQLPPVPQTESLAVLVQTLMHEGVCPDGTRRTRNMSQIAAAAGKSRRQIDNLIKGRSKSAQQTTFEGLLRAFFGNNPSYGSEWRQAMAMAWSRGTTERRANATRPSRAVLTERARVRPNGPLILGLPYKRLPLHFMGRDDDLEAVRVDLGDEPHRSVIYGEHGVGKTMLATAYVGRFADQYDIVAWIAAETPAGCEAGLLALKGYLSDPGDRLTPSGAVEDVLVLIERSKRRILLIYDNARSPDELYAFLPGGSNTHILITSSSPNWRAEAKPRLLNAWTNGVGAQYLIRRLGSPSSGQAPSQLSALLGGLPIALELAAAYCESRCMRIEDYLSAFRSDPMSFLADGDLLPATYPTPIADVIANSIQSAAMDNPTCKPILESISLLATCEVPLFLLHTIVAGDHAEWRSGRRSPASDAMASLRKHALVSFVPDELELQYPRPQQQREDESEPNDGVLAHHLVRHVTKSGIANVQTIERQIIAAVEKLFPLHYDERIDERRTLISPHIVHLLFRGDQLRVDVAWNPWLQAIAHSAMALESRCRCRYKEALAHSRLAHDIIETLDHPLRERALMYLKHDMSFISHVLGIDPKVSGLVLGAHFRSPEED